MSDFKIQLKKGATSNIFQVFIRDSSVTTGVGLTGLAFNTGSLVAYYHRDNDTTATAITLVTMTVGTFTSGGFKEIDATNMPGYYQFCPPDAAVAAGLLGSVIMLKGAANMSPYAMEIMYVGVDLTAAAIPANLTQVDGVANVSATLNLTKLNVVNSAGDAVVFSSTGGNGAGLKASGNGSGHGVSTTGGTTGHGLLAAGGATSGNGVQCQATTAGVGLGCYGVGTGQAGLDCSVSGVSGTGIKANGLGSGHGMWVTGGATGSGIVALGGVTSGAGIVAQAIGGGAGLATYAAGVGGAGILAQGGTNGPGIGAYGVGSGSGMQLGAGVTGHGLDAYGGATSGTGMILHAVGSGNGLQVSGAAGGSGAYFIGNGAGSGVTAQAGTTGNGMHCLGGTTSGNGLVVAAVGAGTGMTAFGVGAKSLLATQGISGPMDTTERDEFAAAALKLDWLTVTGEANFSTLNALRYNRNWSISGTTLTIWADAAHTVAAFSATLTTDAAGVPVVGFAS